MNEAVLIMNDWRHAHSYPLEVAVRSLRMAAARVDPFATVAERLKRLPSITDKLKRQEKMQLSRMQDIGGCRAIVRDIQAVEELVSAYTNACIRVGAGETRKTDYIEEPKSDGYRSVHFICRYRARRRSTKPYDGMRIEIQIRSRLQHAWATAVEVASTYTKQNLKAGSGSESWLRFFALMSSYMASIENQPITPNTPANLQSLRRELKSLSDELKVIVLMRRWSSLTRIRDAHADQDSRVFLVTLRAVESRWYVEVRPFLESQTGQASAEYMEAEKENATKRGVQTVLVSVESIDQLRRAYPNYYADTTEFLKTLQTV